MRKFSFSTEEIDSNKASLNDWHIFVRQREAEMVFSLFPEIKFPAAIELGAGNGLQSVILAQHCDRLVCTEVDEESHSWLGQH